MKPGLIAAGIVSAWTWAAALRQSSNVAYTYGVVSLFYVSPLLLRFCLVLTSPVCCWCNCPNLDVLYSCVQNQDECSSLPHVPRDHSRPLQNVCSRGLYLLRPGNQHLGWLSAPARGFRCGYKSDGDGCLCRHLPHSSDVVAYVLMEGLRAIFLCESTLEQQLSFTNYPRRLLSH